VDGHFVGADGFVVPGDFVEFYERYPKHVRNWVIKRLKRTSVDADVEDWTNTLLMHLSTVPQGTERVDPETGETYLDGGSYAERGFVDVIHAFDPWRSCGADIKRFFKHVNRCILNKFISIVNKQRKDALWYQNHGFSLDDTTGVAPTNTGSVATSQESGREYLLMNRSSSYAEDVAAELPVNANKLFVQQFSEFVQKTEPSLVPLADAIMRYDRIDEVLEGLGIDHNEFLRNRKKLQKLGKAFASR
jgi:hypothetical protein